MVYRSYKYNISNLYIHDLSRAKQLSGSIIPSGRVYIFFYVSFHVKDKVLHIMDRIT